MVDDRCGVITATTTTPGDVAEPSQTLPLVAQHEDNTGRGAAATVADRELVGGMVRNICFANARDYFRMELDPAYAAAK